MTSVDNAVINKPKNIFHGVDGSLPFLLRKEKNPTTNGVSVTTQNGFTDWNISVEINFIELPSAGNLLAGRFLKYKG